MSFELLLQAQYAEPLCLSIPGRQKAEAQLLALR